jgi:hypothetical protein
LLHFHFCAAKLFPAPSQLEIDWGLGGRMRKKTANFCAFKFRFVVFCGVVVVVVVVVFPG